MREVFYGALAAIVLTLAGCQDDQVAQIQEKANQICGYVDKVGAVAKIVAVAASGQVPGGIAVVSGVEATANAICDAWTTKTQTLMGQCPQVNGVCLD